MAEARLAIARRVDDNIEEHSVPGGSIGRNLEGDFIDADQVGRDARGHHASAGIVDADDDLAQNKRIRAGNRMHRFIGIWVVVVDDRVFVRSWSLKPQGWYRTFLAELEVKSVAKTLSLGMTRCRPR